MEMEMERKGKNVKGFWLLNTMRYALCVSEASWRRVSWSVRLVEDKVGNTGSETQGTTIGTVTGVDTVFVMTASNSGGTIGTLDLDVKVWSILVVWVWD